MGFSKRFAVLPPEARHEDHSKSTLHEALLDLWAEHTGRGDRHPSDWTADDWREYHEMIAFRSDARQRQGVRTWRCSSGHDHAAPAHVESCNRRAGLS